MSFKFRFFAIIILLFYKDYNKGVMERHHPLETPEARQAAEPEDEDEFEFRGRGRSEGRNHHDESEHRTSPDRGKPDHGFFAFNLQSSSNSSSSSFF
jgi:hypothetical protein